MHYVVLPHTTGWRERVPLIKKRDLITDLYNFNNQRAAFVCINAIIRRFRVFEHRDQTVFLQYFLCLFRITQACLDKKYVTQYSTVQILTFIDLPREDSHLGINRFLTSPEHWTLNSTQFIKLKSKGIHSPVDVPKDLYKVFSEGLKRASFRDLEAY